MRSKNTHKSQVIKAGGVQNAVFAVATKHSDSCRPTLPGRFCSNEATLQNHITFETIYPCSKGMNSCVILKNLTLIAVYGSTKQEGEGYKIEIKLKNDCLKPYLSQNWEIWDGLQNHISCQSYNNINE